MSLKIIRLGASIISALYLLVSTGCSGMSTISENKGNFYTYTYTMVQPEQNSELKFRDNSIEAQFFIDASAISFQMINHSDQQMSIVWDRVSIGINNRIFSLRNLTTFYASGNIIPQPLYVPPQGFFRETVIPWQNVYYEKGKWIERDLFLSNDSGSLRLKGSIESMIGNEIMLNLPVRIGKLVIDYSFVFKITGVTQLPPNTHPPATERPPMPDKPVYESSVTPSLLPIIISAGILGIAIYLFSQKKQTTSEL